MSYKHEITARVYYQDTDAYGIVYHANYLNFGERGRMEYFRSRGVNLSQKMKELGIIIVIRHCEVHYYSPARIDDELRIVTSVAETKISSAVMHHDIYIGDKLINKVSVTVVAVNNNGVPTRMPDEIRALFE